MNHEDRIQAAVEAFKADSAKLYRTDGTPRYSPEENRLLDPDRAEIKNL